MRKELKNFEWHVYGLSKNDFEETIRIVKSFIKARKEELKQESERVRKRDPICADDILDDIFYYAGIDMQFLWQFCLWRLQSIFEGIITTIILSEDEAKGLGGLKNKLDKLRNRGYKINQEKYNEILEWGRLRNALSHCPPEHYRPAWLEESDIEEYLELVKFVIKDLNIQKKSIKPTGIQIP